VATREIRESENLPEPTGFLKWGIGIFLFRGTWDFLDEKGSSKLGAVLAVLL
jgi:hypothetical protein